MAAEARSGSGLDDQDCEVQTGDAGVLCHSSWWQLCTELWRQVANGIPVESGSHGQAWARFRASRWWEEVKEGRRDTSAILCVVVIAAAGTNGHISQGVLVDFKTSQSQNTYVYQITCSRARSASFPAPKPHIKE